jgi:hypothetical protein
MNHAELFAEALETKLNNIEEERGKTWRYEFTVEHGTKFDRIFMRSGFPERGLGGRSVHAFVEISTGRLVKAATLKKHATWNGELASKWNLSDEIEFQAALDAADFAGGYLYK